MIADASTVATLQSEWTGVVRMRDRMKLRVTATFGFGALTAPGLAKVLYIGAWHLLGRRRNGSVGRLRICDPRQGNAGAYRPAAAFRC
jgi:hypothetical protein